VIVLVILVAAVAMVPLMIFATRSRARRGVRWTGIDWRRGMSEAAKLVIEGTRLHEAGNDEEAIASFDRALALDPRLADALLARAVARQRLGRFDDALADYDHAMRLLGPTCEALNNRGCLHRDRGDLDRALADIEEAIRLAPDYAIGHVSLAEVLAQRGDWDAALAALERGIALDPTWSTHARTADALASLRAARPQSQLFAT
jgi:tetratricopeptide (TPR) repeat protein